MAMQPFRSFLHPYLYKAQNKAEKAFRMSEVHGLLGRLFIFSFDRTRHIYYLWRINVINISTIIPSYRCGIE